MNFLMTLYRHARDFISSRIDHYLMRRALRAAAQSVQPIRLVVGCFSARQQGWLHSDIKVLDVTQASDWRAYFAPSSIEAIVAEHVWEHLPPQQALAGANNCFTFLKPGGYFRIAVPDGLFPNPAYIEQVKVGADGHQVLYTYKTLSHVLEQAGFEVKLLEYFDENGAFHDQKWDADKGIINRSKHLDPRNQGATLVYTSIIIDAVKPSA